MTNAKQATSSSAQTPQKVTAGSMTATPKTSTAQLKNLYNKEIRAQLKKELGLKNIFEVPELEKIVLNVGYGRAKEDNRTKDTVRNTLAKITGQMPIDTIAKASIAGFKLREGQIIGAKVTLRGERMYEFLDRLINIVLPRVRDFRGMPTGSFDPMGNYSMGLGEQSVFAELSFEETTVAHGIQITMTIKNGSPIASQTLLAAFGMPFKKTEGA